MPMRAPLRLAAILTALGLAVAPAAAQEVAVSGANGAGQGYIFRHGGACWLVTAAHLFDEWGDFSLSTSGTPPVTGHGEAAAPFWPGFDVATGVVRGEASDACVTTFSDLDVGWTQSTPLGQMWLALVHQDGSIDRSAMRVVDVPDHKFFIAEFTDGAPAFNGRSGSFLSASGHLAGMVITKPNSDTAGRTLDNAHGFIRIEEIAMNLKRYLDARGVSLAEKARPVESMQDAGFAVVVQSSTLEPAGLGTTAENVLIDDTPFLFRGTGRIVLGVADGNVEDLRGVRIVSKGPEAQPKAITIDIDSNPDGPFVPNWFWSGTMDQAGIFDTGERAPRRMRRIAITVSSSWGGDPRRIDQIILY